MTALKPSGDISDLANNIIQCVETLIPLQAALQVAGEPPLTVNPHGFPLKPLPEIQRNENQKNNESSLASRMSHTTLPDGTSLYALPVVLKGKLEFVLHIHMDRRNGSAADPDSLPRQFTPLEPFCKIAAEAFAHSRASNGTPAVSEEGNSESQNPALKMTSRVLGVIAHDIRTPITVIRGYLKMLLSGRIGPLTPDQKECVEGAMNSMNQLNGLGGLISDASGTLDQIHAEDLTVQEDLWRARWREALGQVQAKGIVLKEQFPGPPLVVCGDRRMLSTVLDKLISCSVGLAGGNTELISEASTRKTGEVVLKIQFSGNSGEPKGEDVVSELLPQVFIHGGKLTYNVTNEHELSFTLTLPGRDS